MIRSRWLVLQAAAVALALSVIPPAPAAGICPYLASGALNMQMNVMPRAPMMMPQMPMMHQPMMQMHQPMLTPPRMAINAQPIHPMMQHTMPGLNSISRMSTPGMNLHVPTLSGNFGIHTQTATQTQWHTQTHSLKIPSLQLNHQTSLHLTGYAHGSLGFTHTGLSYAHTGIGYGHGTLGFGHTGLGYGHASGSLHLSLAMGIKHIPTLGWKSLQLTSSHMTHTSTSTSHLTGQLTMGTRKLHIPSLSFSSRGPSIVPSRPQMGMPSKANPGLSNPIRPGNLHVSAPAPGKAPAPAKPGTGIPSLSVSGKLNMTCGKCHNCKGNASPGTGQIASLPAQPPRTPTLPALQPPILAPRPQVQIQSVPVVRLPLVPPLLSPAPTPYIPQTTVIQQTAVFFPAPQTTNLTLASNPYLTAPKLTSSLGKTLVTPPAPREPSMLTTTPPPAPAPVATAVQLVAADLPPPSVAPVVTPLSGNKLGLLNPMDLVTAPEPEKPAARPVVAEPAKPSMVANLLQPPLLPSGAIVSPREIVHPVLDDPPVLPVLADTLIQPPALRPLPGT